MTVKKGTKENYIVKVISVTEKSNSKGLLYRIKTEEIGFKENILEFDAWDDLYLDIKNNVRINDILIIEAADYEFPKTKDVFKKIYKYKNYTTSYESTIFITNDNCSRGVKNKSYKCFCGKDITNINRKSVYHFYLPKKLSNYVLKDKKCKIVGNTIRDLDNHKNILVREISWVN